MLNTFLLLMLQGPQLCAVLGGHQGQPELWILHFWGLSALVLLSSGCAFSLHCTWEICHIWCSEGIFGGLYIISQFHPTICMAVLSLPAPPQFGSLWFRGANGATEPRIPEALRRANPRAQHILYENKKPIDFWFQAVSGLQLPPRALVLVSVELHTPIATPVSCDHRDVFSSHKCSSGSSLPLENWEHLCSAASPMGAVPSHSLLDHSPVCPGTARQAFRDQKPEKRGYCTLKQRDHIASLFVSPFHLPLRGWQLSDEPFSSGRATEQRWIILPCWSCCPPCWGTGRMCSSGTCPRSMTSTTGTVWLCSPFVTLTPWNAEIPKPHLAHCCLFVSSPISCRIFLHSLENCLGAPERVGCCFLDRVGDSCSCMKQTRRPVFLLVCLLPSVAVAEPGQQRWRRAAAVSTLGSAGIPSWAFCTLWALKVGSRDESPARAGAWQELVPEGDPSWLALQREDFQMYEKYCQNKPRSESLWRQCSESSFFQVSCCSCPGTRPCPQQHTILLPFL